MQLPASPEQIEDKRRLYLLYFFTAIGTVFLIPLGLLSLVKDRLIIAIVLLGLDALLLVLFWFTYRYKRVELVSYIVAVLLMLLSLFLTVGGAVEGTGLYYAYSLTFLMVMITGPRISLLFISVYFALLVTMLNLDAVWVYNYTDAQYMRLLISMFILASLANAGEWIRVATYGQVADVATSSLQMALTDTLTGVMNRTGAKALLKDWPEAHYPAVVVLIDLDHFKAVNDEYGHEAGDHVLQYFAQCARSHLKGRDILARWGGEEFLLVLPVTELDAAEQLIETIRLQFAEHRFRAASGTFQVSFSAGLATLLSKPYFDPTLKQADIQLYAAKAAGRNCSQCFRG